MLLGQEQTSYGQTPMSALPPKADIESQSRNVRFVPQADSVFLPRSTSPASSQSSSCPDYLSRSPDVFGLFLMTRLAAGVEELTAPPTS